MMHSYLRLPDETQFAYSSILEDNTVEVRVERPRDWGFDSARRFLSACQWLGVDGFSEDEMGKLDTLLRNNALVI